MADCTMLKVGDPVFITDRHCKTLHKVQKITPKGFIKVEGTLYHPKDGSERTSDPWYHTRIHPATEDEIIKYKEQRYIQKVIMHMNNIDGMSIQLARQIGKLLGVEEDE